MAMKRGWIATIQVFIPSEDRSAVPIDSEAAACDAVSGGMEIAGIHDWAYLQIGGQILSPTEKYYDPDNYEEGDAFV
jgi:hypothetical protein